MHPVNSEVATQLYSLPGETRCPELCTYVFSTRSGGGESDSVRGTRKDLVVHGIADRPA